MVYDRETKIEYNAINLFTKSGLVVNDENNLQPKLKYYVKELKHFSEYGYRYLFEHEMQNKPGILKDYKEIQVPNIKNNLIKPELDAEIWRKLLNDINREDPKQRELRLKEHMEQAMTSIVQSLLSDVFEKIKNEFTARTTNDTSNTVPDSRMLFGTSVGNIQAQNVKNVQSVNSSNIESQTFTCN